MSIKVPQMRLDPDFLADKRNTEPFEKLNSEQKQDKRKREMLLACKRLMSEKQYTYFIERYGYKHQIKFIAKRYGVNPSTVSRTIKRGLNRCKKLIVFD